jgi:hypothetical protein
MAHYPSPPGPSSSSTLRAVVYVSQHCPCIRTDYGAETVLLRIVGWSMTCGHARLVYKGPHVRHRVTVSALFSTPSVPNYKLTWIVKKSCRGYTYVSQHAFLSSLVIICFTFMNCSSYKFSLCEKDSRSIIRCQLPRCEARRCSRARRLNTCAF